MKIQLKRSNVLQSGAAKEPTASQLEYGELAINYSNSDPAIFLKDSNNNIIRISGVGNIADDGLTNVPAGTTPPTNPTPESGNLWYNSDEGRLYIYYVDANTSQWVDASPDSWDPTVMPDTTNPAAQTGTLDDRYVMENGDTMTGALILPSGTAAAPALGVGSTDNGLYSPGTDEVALATNGAGALFIDSSGNVSVGTATANSVLHLASSNDPAITIADTSVADTHEQTVLMNNSGNFNIRTHANDGTFKAIDYVINRGASGATSHEWRIGNSEKMQLDSSGRLGVGTSSPAIPLDVYGADTNANGLGDVKGQLRVFNDTTAFGSSPRAGIVFSTKYRTSPDIPLDGAAIYGGKENATDTNKDFFLAFATRDESPNEAVERMRIDSSGRVGIGTTSPAAELHVENSGGNCGTRIISSTSGVSYLNLGDTTDNNIGSIEYDNSVNALKLITNNTERMRIDSSGNVGIGTSSPQSKLDVRGGINVSSASNVDTVIQRNIAPIGSYSLILSGGAGLTGETYPVTAPTDATAGSAIKLMGGNPANDSFGGGITYFANGNVSPNVTGPGNAHVFYTRSGVNTYSERFRIRYDGGVTFNGDTAAANALDDYEEGTWTPVVCGVTPSVENAYYTKIGRVVIVKARVTVSTAPSASSNPFTITGLPFAASVINGYNGFLVGYTSDHNWPGNLNGGVSKFFPEIRLYIAGSTNVWTVNNYIAIRGNANDTLEFQCTYFV